MKNRSYLLCSALIAALGGLLFGFDTAVISGTTDALKEVFDLDKAWLGFSGAFWLGFTVAIALIGTVIGSLAVGRPADRLGRRAVLMVIAVLYFVSAVGSGLAWDWWSFLVFRLVGGLAVGGASVVAPMYIAEISPAQYRGRLVAITQFNIVLGILLAFFSNYLVAQLDLGAIEWRWMFGVEAFPATVFFFLLFLTPFSPRWLVARQRTEEAAAVLARLGSDAGSVESEIGEIKASLDLAHHTVKEPFYCRKYIKPIMLAVAIAAFNQLSGINALMYYARDIFEMAGAGRNSALLNSVAVGGINLVFTMLALLVIDHFGRKKLMLVGSLGYILSLSVTAWAFYTYASDFSGAADAKTATEAAVRADALAEAVFMGDSEHIQRELVAANEAIKAASDADLKTVAENATQVLQAAQAGDSTAAAAAAMLTNDAADEVRQRVDRAAVSTGGMVVLISLLVFIASHAFGQGAVIWVFISEIFPNRVRARGQALGSFTHWFMCAGISLTFPMFAQASGGHTFAFYAAMMVLQLFWVLMIMPETKGVPLEEIQKKLGIE